MKLKVIFIYLVLCLPVFGKELSILDSLSRLMRAPGGIKMSFFIKQIQLGDEWTDRVVMEIINPDQFIFETPQQVVKIDTNVIYTYNLESQQVIIDSLIKEDFSLYDILTGNFNRVEITNVENMDSTRAIDFFIADMDYSGTIWVTKKDIHPTRIVINYNSDSSVELIIESFGSLTDDRLFDQYRLEGWEVIDLRE
ncbi:MAG: hypothetical protein GXO92_08710 [FCB group bacterium]|nr:hypothetical protein [FCB group bacterium]